MKRGISLKIIAGFITFGVLIMLLLTGPAQAYIIGMTISDNEVNKGEKVKFDIEIEVEPNEFLDVDFFTLKLMGPMSEECNFDVDGNIISGCLGMTIQKIKKPDYEYGYGFKEGKFQYKITLETFSYLSGMYDSLIEMHIGPDTFTQTGAYIIIKSVIDELEGCSVRGRGGTLTVQGKDYGKPKINFHLPLGNANNGKGSLTGQSGKERFSYKFEIVNVLSNNQYGAWILVSGECCHSRNQKSPEDSIIYFDKANNILNISGINPGTIKLIDANVTFRKRC